MNNQSYSELEGKRVLITSGATRSYIDAVRYITNSSTGRLGSIIAKEFLKNKFKITFIYGRDSLVPSEKTNNLILREFITVSDLSDIIKKELKNNRYDIIIHLAGVSDYEPERTYKWKIKSDRKKLIIKLKRTSKIIEYIRSLARSSFLVCFKLEVGISEEELIKKAYSLLIKAKADLVVANDLKKIKENKHHALIIDKNKRVIAEANTKEEISKRLVKFIAKEVK